jgi:hypothetical protein
MSKLATLSAVFIFLVLFWVLLFDGMAHEADQRTAQAQELFDAK